MFLPINHVEQQPGWPLNPFYHLASLSASPLYGSLLTLCSLDLVATVRGDSKVAGTITFEQASESAPTTITWDFTGNDANAKRGFHIHQFGDNTNGCTSAGPHCKLDPEHSECSDICWKGY